MVRRKLLYVFIMLALSLFATGGVAWYVLGRSEPSQVTLGDGVFAARVARSTSELEQGLSATSNLEANQAMLFVFKSDSHWGIWMKDMTYPIDIVWLSSDKKVVYVVENAQPSSYPKTTYAPAKLARYVLELKAGTVAQKRITIGAQAAFDSTKGTYK